MCFESHAGTRKEDFIFIFVSGKLYMFDENDMYLKRFKEFEQENDLFVNYTRYV